MLTENFKCELILTDVQNNNIYRNDRMRKVHSVNIVCFSVGYGKNLACYGKQNSRVFTPTKCLNLPRSRNSHPRLVLPANCVPPTAYSDFPTTP